MAKYTLNFRNDRVKTELASMAIYCGLNSTVEPYGLFGSLLPQQPLNRLQYRQSKVVLRPDLLLHLPSNTSGVNERRIADVKTVSLGGRSFYKPGMDGEKAVEIRAKHIQNEYDNKAKKMDAELGHGDGQGPALRRLRELGSVVDLCFGGYAEASTSVWRLLNHMATARLAKQGLARPSLFRAGPARPGNGHPFRAYLSFWTLLELCRDSWSPWSQDPGP